MIHITTEQLQPWLFRFIDPLSDENLNVYSYLIVGSNKALLYDTGHGIGDYTGTIRTITNLPFDVVISHAHIDHVNGAFQFPTVYMSPKEQEVFKEHTSERFRGSLAKRAVELGYDIDRDDWVKQQVHDIKELVVGQIFDLGDFSVEAIDLAGHTSGSIGLYIKDKNTILSSDGINNHLWLFLHESLKREEYTTMLERTLTLDFIDLYTGHDPRVQSKDDVKKYLQVAQHASIDNAKPYSAFPELSPIFYEEDGVVFVFNERTIS